MTVGRRQFALRAFLVWVLLLSVLISVAVHSDQSTLIGFVSFLASIRLMILCLIGVPMGVLTGRLRRVLIVMTVGFFVADVFLATVQREQVVVLYDPLVLMTMIVCSSTMIENRAWSLGISIGFSVIVPIILVTWFCVHTASKVAANPDLRGAGLATVVALVFGAATLTCGLIVTVVARVAFEIGLQRLRRLPGAGSRNSSIV
jgi:hypothetical protein